MNENIRSTPQRQRIGRVALCLTIALVLCACHKAPTSAPAESATKDQGDESKGGKEKDKTDAPKGESGAEEGVALKPDEIEKMGIVTAEARAITSAPEVSGFGVVVPHDIVATPVAELRTAIAAARQSRSAFDRTHRLTGTPGAMPAETQEGAQKQAAADQAALELARQKLSSILGQDAPWKNSDNDPELLALASGQSKLVRTTFPLGSLGDAAPTSLRLAHIDGSQGVGSSWRSTSVWRAPADTNVPGRSFFAILKTTEASEGDHLMAWAPVGAPETGVLVPASAVIITAGRFWCYVQEKPGTFVRTSVDPSKPTEQGYFVKEGISPGDKIVVSAAGQLLARESNPSSQAE